MFDNWIIIALGGLFALFLGRSAIIVLWPESEAAKFCENQLGIMDSVGDSNGDDGNCGHGGGD
ncbi:MAG TPA: hypothetical protein VKN37_06570 [Roseovarius sp.]|nr:hypothetical protein [Roseovarius sp.]